MKCKECEHCKMTSRANIKFAGGGYGGYGRGEFFCEHPDVGKMHPRDFGNRAPGFIGFGTMEKESVVQIKTSPRWCPLRRASHDR